MPRYIAQGSDADSLVALIDQAEAHGEEVVQCLPAGDSWVVVAKKKAGRPPKKIETR